MPNQWMKKNKNMKESICVKNVFLSKLSRAQQLNQHRKPKKALIIKESKKWKLNQIKKLKNENLHFENKIYLLVKIN